ncbi:protein ANTAGONIST OF LIKE HETEROCHROMATIN PROTEIN 1-like [Arachis hypogaea]|uniref:protein ANTAGONIST OF LIKE HETEROCHROMATIN PROTEIN 1-like n=1 Tax=Arachis hypogaea TaxID=3818 RepID=UPI000DED06D5|nr:protein ALP1-like [Arachis hypogaea]
MAGALPEHKPALAEEGNGLCGEKKTRRKTIIGSGKKLVPTAEVVPNWNRSSREVSLGGRMNSRIRRDALERIIGEGDRNCIWELRMNTNAFANLCELLQVQGGLCEDGQVSLPEQVATFLIILAHHKKNRSLQVRFCRSGKTVSKYFNKVLKAIIRMQKLLFAKASPVEEDCIDPTWRKFKGCLGALNGIYIEVTVPESDKSRYRTRKGKICTNVLGVCNREMSFVYVLSGWEGSASDSRILRDAITRGNYYLVDAGYTNGPRFLAPYKGTRYHVREWAQGTRAPRNYQEYFNRKHSSARNVIERCFGLLKKRWSILRSPSFYPIKTQNQIIIACCLLQNFIRKNMDMDPEEQTSFLDEFLPVEEEAPDELIDVVENTNELTQWRDNIAIEMYEEWRTSRTE